MSESSASLQAGEAGKSRQERLAVACVALTAFTFQFEAFLVNVSLPDIARELNTSSNSVSFVVIAYLLASTVAFVPMGRLGHRWGMRRVFLSGCLTALLGTLSSGLSFSLEMLWISRAVQGIGMGAMVAIGYAIIPRVVRKQRIGWGYGMLTMGAASGMVLGLPAGGLWSYFLNWHWVFLGTAPILAALFLFSWLVLPRDSGTDEPTNALNPPGFLAYALSLTGIVLSISLGNRMGWHSPAVISVGAVTLLSLTAFVLQTRNDTRSYLSLRLLRNRGFSRSLVVLFVFQSTIGGIVFLIPFLLELVCGLSPLASSMVLLIYPISLAISSAWAGKTSDRLESRPMVVVAGCLGAVTSILFAIVLILGVEETRLATLCLLLYGISTGMFFAPNNRFTMSRVAADLRGEAGALLPVALNMGSIVGVALYDAIFIRHIPRAELSIRTLSSCSSDVTASLQHGFADAFLVASGLMLLAAGLALAFYRNEQAVTGNTSGDNTGKRFPNLIRSGEGSTPH